MRALITLCKSIMKNISNTNFVSEKKELSARSRINIGETRYFAEVVLAIENVVSGGKFIATIYDYSSLFNGILKEIKDKYKLTDREYKILQCIIKGMSNQEISNELFISVPTVKKHLSSIYEKMDIEGKHQILGTMI